jgi:predicted ribosome quality control (RQC) complex YloA/Tae2 family protein
MPNSELLANVSAGRVVERPFIQVTFQQGLPQEVGVNGCRVEDVIEVAMARLEEYQLATLACEENEQALDALKHAKKALEERRRRRMEQGVFNTMAQHVINRTEDEHEDFSATGA